MPTRQDLQDVIDRMETLARLAQKNIDILEHWKLNMPKDDEVDGF